jgi:hypothetical protein
VNANCVRSGSVAHHAGTEALAVRRPLAGRVDHVTVSERLDRCRQLAGRVDNCAVTERPNHRRWLHRPPAGQSAPV